MGYAPPIVVGPTGDVGSGGSGSTGATGPTGPAGADCDLDIDGGTAATNFTSCPVVDGGVA